MSPQLTTSQIEQHNAQYDAHYRTSTTIGDEENENGLDNMEKEDDNMSTISDKTMSDYCLEWLFDPTRIDHLPLEEQVAMFKKRDLRQVKVFKVACKYWDPPRSRKRVIFAGPMEGAEVFHKARHHKVIPPIENREKEKEDLSVKSDKNDDDEESYENYQQWLKERKAFRSDLENMGLNEKWLNSKPAKTVLEKRVLARMIDARTPRPCITPPVQEIPVDAYLREDNPLVKRPSPAAIRLIERFLQKKKIRLIDLFASVDKNKDWKVSRVEFKNAVQEAGIPISDVMLEDLVLALDKDLTDKLDYRELAKGMGLWKVEKRANKRSRVASGISQISNLDSLGSASKPSTRQRTARSVDDTGTPAASSHRAVSALSNYSSSSSQYLEPPPSDMRSEHLMLSSEEAMVDQRKRDRAALAQLTKDKRQGNLGNQPNISGMERFESSEVPIIVKTGDNYVDQHSKPSTMAGEMGDMLDQYRRVRLREYHEVVKMCRQNMIPLTVGLLERVLLFPADKPHSELQGHIRQPQQLIVQKQSSPGGASSRSTSLTTGARSQRAKKTTKLPDRSKMTARQVEMSVRAARSRETTQSSEMTRRSSGQRKGFTQNGSTSGGNVDASQATQDNENMTFQQYEQVTRHLSNKYGNQQSQKSSPNAFWPGQLLDKLRLHMPNPEPKAGAVFNTVQRPSEKRIYPGYNNDLKTWPINNSGYVQYGSIC